MSRSGSYSTEKRAKILEYLKSHSDEDVCVKDIETHIRCCDGISVNVTTIYRYLDKLEKEGQVLKHSSEDGMKTTYQYAEYEQSCQNHLHMKCSLCGRIQHMDCEFMDEFKKHMYEHHRFALECRTSMLYGICESCLNNHPVS